MQLPGNNALVGHLFGTLSFRSQKIASVKWSVRIASGIVIGIAAVWIDALLCSFITGGSGFSLNLVLLRSASVPAGAVRDASCFGVALGARFLDTTSSIKTIGSAKHGHRIFHVPVWRHA